jgi:hypothetical protein
MSLTAYTKAWSLLFGAESRRWHLNEKLLLFDDELKSMSQDFTRTVHLFLPRI